MSHSILAALAALTLALFVRPACATETSKARPIYSLSSVELVDGSTDKRVVLMGDDDSRIVVAATATEVAAAFPGGETKGTPITWRKGAGLINLFAVEAPRIERVVCRLLAFELVFSDPIGSFPAKTKAGTVTQDEFNEYLAIALGRRSTVLARLVLNRVIETADEISPIKGLVKFDWIDDTQQHQLRFFLNGEVGWTRNMLHNGVFEPIQGGVLRPKAPYVTRTWRTGP